MRNNQDGTYLTTNYLGDTFNMTLSPNADDKVIFDSEKILPFEIQLSPADTAVPTILGHMAEGSVNAKSNNASYYKYAEHSLMVAPNVDANGQVAGIKLFDITEGINAATEITLKGADITPATPAYAAGHGELKLTINEVTGALTKAEINMMLVTNEKVVKFTQTAPPATNVTPASSGTANPFAYALSSEVVEGTLKVNYTLNADATAVAINVMDAEGEVVATATGETAKGAHTADIAVADLAAAPAFS